MAPPRVGLTLGDIGTHLVRLKEMSAKAFEQWFAWELPSGWVFVYRLLEENGTLIVRELRVVATEDHDALGAGRRRGAPGGIGATLLRQFTIEGALAHARGEAHAYLLAPVARGRPGRRLSSEAKSAQAATRRSRRQWEKMRPFLHGDSGATGRKGHPDIYYAQIAQHYVKAILAGSRKPIADLAQREHLSPSRVSELVVKARRRGLLSGSLPGRAGGLLTTKAKKLLREGRSGKDTPGQRKPSAAREQRGGTR